MKDINAFLGTMQRAYRFENESITLGAAMLEDRVLPEAPVRIPLRMLNRHGLITGATGTGKTASLALLAENLSEAGVPVLLMDIKGDLSGLAFPGKETPAISERHSKIGLSWSPSGFPVELLTLSKEKGVRLRATVSEFGPILFSKMLGLNETQASLISLIFKFCDDKQLPLVDLKDFKKVLEYVTGEAKANVQAEYGLVSTTSISLILRKLIELEQQGAQEFFGEPSFEVQDLLRTDNGFGVLSILRLADIQDRPKLFSSFMLQLLAEVFATLPEAGDLAKPKLVIFIDEAHLIFDEAEKTLLDQIETVVRLIRSKGVGIFFCTQSPNDIPAAVLGQLGLKVQHALRAFTAKDRKEIKSISENYPESNFYDTDEVLTTLGIGEALVTALDERGSPTPLVRTMLVAPRSRLGVLSPAEIEAVLARSTLISKYNTPLDRESAYEILGGKIQTAISASGQQAPEQRRSWSPSARAEIPPVPAPQEMEPGASRLPYPKPIMREPKTHSGSMMDGVGAQVARQVGRTVAATVTGILVRQLLGVLGVSGRRRR